MSGSSLSVSEAIPPAVHLARKPRLSFASKDYVQSYSESDESRKAKQEAAAPALKAADEITASRAVNSVASMSAGLNAAPAPLPAGLSAAIQQPVSVDRPGVSEAQLVAGAKAAKQQAAAAASKQRRQQKNGDAAAPDPVAPYMDVYQETYTAALAAAAALDGDELDSLESRDAA